MGTRGRGSHSPQCGCVKGWCQKAPCGRRILSHPKGGGTRTVMNQVRIPKLLEGEEEEEGKPFFHPALPELVGGGLGPACGTTQQFDDPAFQPHQPYGSCSKEEWHDSLERYKFNIIDKLQLPDLEPGEYVLSFRWDCEQSPQIWSGCSDITIKSSYDIFP